MATTSFEKLRLSWPAGLLLILLTLAAGPSASVGASVVGSEHPVATFPARVMGVTSGDTLILRHQGEDLRVRLFGVDCPEAGQRFESESRRLTLALSQDQTVEVHTYGRDKGDVILADVVLQDGRLLAHELVRNGMAWWYEAHASNSGLGRANKAAKPAPLGLAAPRDPARKGRGVVQGLTWWHWKHRRDQAIRKLEDSARRERVGLWADPRPIPPWNWRPSSRVERAWSQ